MKRNMPVQPMHNTLEHRRDLAILCFLAQTGSGMDGLQGEPMYGASNCLRPVMMTY